MVWPFTSKPRRPSLDGERLPVLEFKSAEAFFEMQCKSAGSDIRPGVGMVAIVLDATKAFGASVAVKVEADGTQTAMLKVASEEGGFVVPAKTPTKGDALAPGDVVVWVPMLYNRDIAEKARDDKFGWVGLIASKIAPSFDPNPGDHYRILSKYGPPTR